MASINDNEQPMLNENEKIASFELTADENARSDRVNFITKVYGILFVMQTITAVMTSILVSTDQTGTQDMTTMFWVCLSLSTVVMILVCIPKVSRRVPVNYILLLVYTLSFSFVITWLFSWIYPAIGVCFTTMTASVTLSLFLYSLTAKKDFKLGMGMVWVTGMSIIVTIVFGLCYDFGAWWHLVLCALWIMLWGLYLIHDMRIVAGGGYHFAALGVDDYSIGALVIYIDIVSVILSAAGNDNERRDDRYAYNNRCYGRGFTGPAFYGPQRAGFLN